MRDPDKERSQKFNKNKDTEVLVDTCSSLPPERITHSINR